MALATAVAAVVPLAGVAAPAAHAATGHTAASSKATDKSAIVPGRYIVMMKAAPLARYTGGMKGFPRTKPLAGHKLDMRSVAATKYKHHLLSTHRSVLGKAGISARSIANNYSVAFNGFSAKLTKAQAAKLAQTGGVARVWPVELRTADTVSTPAFLGLDGPGGVWNSQFGGSPNAGRGMIIADLDSGIWPENPSFDKLAATPDHKQIQAKWNGTCDKGVRDKIKCNNKVIGARYYGADFGNDISDDFDSPRDFNGHGSHTASTAAGNHGVPVTISGYALGDASGMAPAARIAVYKVLWEDAAAANASGTTEGIVAAIDDAVADGADVINYSISGSSSFIVSPDEIAFLGAANAGVFVSASAGNSGPTASTVAHNAPWEMTVAADTHDRGAVKSVTLGNGATYTGMGYGAGVGPAPVVNSPAAAVAGADATKANLCYSAASNDGVAVLDPAKVAGKIVVCTRGTNARVDKSLAVKEAGGVGMILADNGSGVTADFHAVPSVHINLADGTAVKAYVAGTPNPTATISAQDSSPVEAPNVAGFSSRGPAVAGGGDLLKPDIAAPGVGIFAAVAPPGNAGENFQSYDGTSMAAPHITGIAALILQKHPTWSPMWVKSAIMTTATQLTNRNRPIQGASGNATPFEMGAGHVQAAPAFNPGLVYDSTVVDWLAYGCAIGQVQLVSTVCSQVPVIDPSDFNSPSIAIGALPGDQTITRTVTNASGIASNYHVSVDAPPGTTVTVNTPSFRAVPGGKATYTVTITRTTAPLNAYTFGSLTWSDDAGHSVRIPIAVRPVAAAFPSQVTGNGTSGSKPITVQPGYTGTLTASVSGLVPATVSTTAETAKGTKAVVPITIPAGTTYARFATYDADYPAGTDIDLLVKNSAGTTVGSSGGATAEESVNLINPAAGNYTVEVTYFAGSTATLAMKLNSFLLGSADAGNMTATPASQAVTLGTPATVTAAWSGLAANTRYLGAVNFGDGTNPLGRTIVNVLP
ncbi:S8 family peptidase [Nocardioides islandensis]|uniref:S8 family peptidase n=1 Tax=Nocardioides islandensis TaxID=433663 RepID=UPI002B27881B|nr:S8 family peptidase [Nocardioides islandensis]